MSNIHTPQRLEGESQAAYKQRRADSKAVQKKVKNPVLLASSITGDSDIRKSEQHFNNHNYSYIKKR